MRNLTKTDLAELKRIVDKGHPSAPYFDNVVGYQELSEIACVNDWADEMRKQGYSICDIDENPDDPPDIVAEMDGKPIGIEVTYLVEYPSGAGWTLSGFQDRLIGIVEKKDKQLRRKKEERVRQQGKQALDCRLYGMFLLIFAPEPNLQDELAKYIEKTKLSWVKSIDRVFVMGDYFPTLGHSVHEVQQSSGTNR